MNVVSVSAECVRVERAGQLYDIDWSTLREAAYQDDDELRRAYAPVYITAVRQYSGLAMSADARAEWVNAEQIRIEARHPVADLAAIGESRAAVEAARLRDLEYVRAGIKLPRRGRPAAY